MKCWFDVRHTFRPISTRYQHPISKTNGEERQNGRNICTFFCISSDWFLPARSMIGYEMARKYFCIDDFSEFARFFFLLPIVFVVTFVCAGECKGNEQSLSGQFRSFADNPTSAIRKKSAYKQLMTSQLRMIRCWLRALFRHWPHFQMQSLCIVLILP